MNPPLMSGNARPFFDLSAILGMVSYDSEGNLDWVAPTFHLRRVHRLIIQGNYVDAFWFGFDYRI